MTMWVTTSEVRLGAADVEFRDIIYDYGEDTLLPDRVQSADELIDMVIPRWLFDGAWKWAASQKRYMSPIIMVSARQNGVHGL